MKSTFLIVFCFATVLCSANAIEESEHAKAVSEDSDDVTQFFSAIRARNVSAVQSLIDRGADVNADALRRNSRTGVFTPLHALIDGYRSFNEEILKVLLKNGADMEATDVIGRTPLYCAIDNENVKAVEILLKNGANPNTNDTYDNASALQAAFKISTFGNEDIVDLLIEYGADINQTDKYGRTPLHEAIRKKLKKATEMLIEKGANVNAVENEMKMTPLHNIANVDSDGNSNYFWSDDDTLKYAEQLLDRGADVYAKAHYQNHDQTPLDLATSKKLRKLLGSKMGFMGWLRTIW